MHQPPNQQHDYPTYSQPTYSQPQPGYGQGGFPPPKRGMSTGTILLIVLGCLFGGCVMCGAIGAASKKGGAASSASTANAKVDPSAEAAKLAAQQKMAEEAKAAREKTAIDTFPTKKTEIASTLKKASTEADTNKWAQADSDLTSAENSLADFRGTSVADQKEFQDLDSKASALRKRVAPQAEKLAKAAAAASAEKELRASSVVVSNMQLFSDYQANEVAADAKYKGKQLLVTGTVASIGKGPFGGLILRLATTNEFMSTMCSMEKSETSDMAELQKGEQVRVLCKGRGMVLGSPSLDDCVFR